MSRKTPAAMSCDEIQDRFSVASFYKIPKGIPVGISEAILRKKFYDESFDKYLEKIPKKT